MTSQITDSFEPSVMTDKRLLAVTSFYRNLASGGDKGAEAVVAKCEQEMARRFGGATTLVADLVAVQSARKRWLPF